MNTNRPLILLVDDSDLNRAMLSEILETKYDIIEASDGFEALSILQTRLDRISLVFLDIVMPVMDGIEVLEKMNEKKWIDDIPVIMITADRSHDTSKRAYELGAQDFISRPYDSFVIQKRVENILMLYAKQQRLADLVTEEIMESERSNSAMISILSNIVESKNGESGLHVLHINIITEILLTKLATKHSDLYSLTDKDIKDIANASALHDIGKINIPDSILNKPGKLTDEEFAVMKTHTIQGAEMLESLIDFKDDQLVKYAIEICRWHHEKYDGGGYPDGLVGDEIPIAAQVVSIADVYDALTSERCYKKAFTHEEAINMIVNGECGSFNPIIVNCLLEISDFLKNELRTTINYTNKKQIDHLAGKLVKNADLSRTDRTLKLLEVERQKIKIFAKMSSAVLFEYDPKIQMLHIIDYQKVTAGGIDEFINKPFSDPQLIEVLGQENLWDYWESSKSMTYENPSLIKEYTITLNGHKMLWKFHFQAIYDEEGEIVSYAGHAVPLDNKNAF